MKIDSLKELATMDRRSFIGRSAFAASALALGGMEHLFAQDARGLPMSPVVQTGSGKVRGLVRYGVNQFFGVPYGASTAGANRFMPPARPLSWTGVRDTVQVTERAPYDGGGPISEVWSLDRREDMGEDCLSINVFTPGLGTGNRPVMVWLHAAGSAAAPGTGCCTTGRISRARKTSWSSP